MTQRVYPLHYYNEAGWLKVPFPLWLTLAIGVQHLWFLAPKLYPLLPELGDLLFDMRLLAGDLLTLTLFLAVGHRMSGGGLSVMRGVWRYGWWILLVAYLATLLGFTYRQWAVLGWAEHRHHNWAVFVLMLNLLPLVYLLLSRHVRDVFAHGPLVLPTPASVPEPVKSPAEPIGQVLRKQEAQGILGQYPVADGASAQEISARQRLQEDLENAALWHGLGAFYAHQGRNDAAMDFLRQATRIDGKNPGYHSDLAELCRRQGLLQEALEMGFIAVRLAPKDADGHYNLGIMLTQAKRFQEAAQSYRNALAINPQMVVAQENLQQLLAFLNSARPTT